MTDDTRSEQALRDHLAATAPDVEYSIRPLGLGVDGWSFFAATPVDIRDATPSSYAVREDGTVLDGDPGDDLARVLRSMDLLDRDDVSAATLARVARAVLTDGVALVDEDDVERWSDPEHQPGADLAPPAVTATDGGLELTFWVRSLGRGTTFSEFTVSIAPDYRVEWDEHVPDRA